MTTRQARAGPDRHSVHPARLRRHLNRLLLPTTSFANLAAREGGPSLERALTPMPRIHTKKMQAALVASALTLTLSAPGSSAVGAKAPGPASALATQTSTSTASEQATARHQRTELIAHALAAPDPIAAARTTAPMSPTQAERRTDICDAVPTSRTSVPRMLSPVIRRTLSLRYPGDQRHTALLGARWTGRNLVIGRNTSRPTVTKVTCFDWLLRRFVRTPDGGIQAETLKIGKTTYDRTGDGGAGFALKYRDGGWDSDVVYAVRLYANNPRFRTSERIDRIVANPRSDNELIRSCEIQAYFEQSVRVNAAAVSAAAGAMPPKWQESGIGQIVTLAASEGPSILDALNFHPVVNLEEDLAEAAAEKLAEDSLNKKYNGVVVTGADTHNGRTRRIPITVENIERGRAWVGVLSDITSLKTIAQETDKAIMEKCYS